MDKGSLEVLLGQGLSVARIAERFGKDPSTVSYWMEKYGLEANNRAKHAAKGGIAREVLEPLVEAGMTIAEIAAEVDRGKATVRHWLGRYGLRTKNARGRRPAEAMAREGCRAPIPAADVRAPWRDGARPGGPWAIPLQAVPRRSRGAAPSQGEGDARGGSRRVLRRLRIRPLPDGACIPPSRPEREAAGETLFAKSCQRETVSEKLLAKSG